MEDSVWPGTLSDFRNRLAGTDRAPAGVAAACVAAILALSLLTKVLKIVGRRKEIPRELVRKAGHLADELAQIADTDIAAVLSKDTARMAEAPLGAARLAAAGLDLCVGAAPLVSGAIASDLAAASLLLRASIQAMLV